MASASLLLGFLSIAATPALGGSLLPTSTTAVGQPQPQPLPIDVDTAAADGDTPVSWKELTGRAGRVQLYGALRVDAHFTDSLVNDPRAPQYALSEGNISFFAGRERTETNVDDSTYVMHPRLSRFGLNATSNPIEALWNAEVSGKLEIDFFGAGSSESRALPRMRHFWGKLSWDAFYLLFGQTSDLIAPLFPAVNNEALMWNAGNLGDRQPQVQLGFMPRLGPVTLVAQAAIGQEGARTDADIDGSGVRDGDDSGVPQLQGRAGFMLDHWVEGTPIVLAGWGVLGRQHLVLLSPFPVSLSEKSEFATFAVGADLTLPITSFLSLQGEVWSGKNLADLRGGIGQVIDPRTGTEIRAIGGWLELKLSPFSWWTLALGAGLDDPQDEDVPRRGQRSQNRVLWAGNAFTFEGFTLGLDYSNWHTEWSRLNAGVAHRFSSYLMYSF